MYKKLDKGYTIKEHFIFITIKILINELKNEGKESPLRLV
jgi:hypothetical protein